MIKNIQFKSYKKLKNITISFEKGINIIAGTNGTCKSSILHVISNSYQRIPYSSIKVTDVDCIKSICSINKYIVPKIETLNKGSRAKNDPSKRHLAPIYTVTFDDNTKQDFRKHNSDGRKVGSSCRYSVKPKYIKGSKEKLREAMIIYLSLDRLFPFPEYEDEDKIKKINSKLPQKYQKDIINSFKSFTDHDITFENIQNIGKIKKKLNFSTKDENIDSNTISSGEDNLLIILTAIYSLIYYIDSLKEDYKSETVYLLVDEFDASLHPEFQIKLLTLLSKKMRIYSNFNFIATSHSITTLEEIINKKKNLIYLINRGTHVEQFINADMKKIKSILEMKLHKDLFSDSKIPIVSEDAEARIFLDRILKFLSKKDSKFSK